MLYPTDWTIDPSKTCIFIYTWPDDMVTHALMEWLYTRFRNDQSPAGLINYIKWHDIVCARNYVMQAALKSDPHYETFLFCDNDLKPDKAAEEMFRLETNIKCCKVARDGPNSWPRPDSFHDAFWCINREDLVKIDAPYFSHPQLNEDGTLISSCMCNSFAYKAKKAGLTIGHAGHCLHGDKTTW